MHKSRTRGFAAQETDTTALPRQSSSKTIPTGLSAEMVHTIHGRENSTVNRGSEDQSMRGQTGAHVVADSSREASAGENVQLSAVNTDLPMFDYGNSNL